LHSLRPDRALGAAYFVVAPGRKACPLAPPQHGAARSMSDCSSRCTRSARIALLVPPTLSSLRDEKRVPSLLLSTAPRDPCLIAPLAALAPPGSRSWCRLLCRRSGTKSVSPRSSSARRRAI